MADERGVGRVSEGAAQAAQVCTTCPKLCHFVCPVAEAEARETVTPWGLMRLLELTRRGDVALDAEIGEVWHHCTGCGQCTAWCHHGNEVGQAMVEARGWVWEQGAAPTAVGAALARAELQGAPRAQRRMGEDELDAVFDPMAAVAYVPDCETVSARPELVLRAGRLLRLVLGERVRLVAAGAEDGPGCCGSWWRVAGDEEGARLREGWMDEALAGAERVIVECPGMWRARGGAVEHILEVIARGVSSGALAPPAHALEAAGATWFEDCQAGRAGGLGAVMAEVAALVFEEGLAGREEGCCGGGGTYPWVAPAESVQMAQELARGAERLVCGASGCQRQLEGAGAEAIDLLEAVCLAYGL